MKQCPFCHTPLPEGNIIRCPMCAYHIGTEKTVKKEIVRTKEQEAELLKRWGEEIKERGKKGRNDDFTYNDSLFYRFYLDLHNDSLPDIPEPTEYEIEIYKHRKSDENARIESEFVNIKGLQANSVIPAEIDIWVDKVFSYYFDDLKPMLGMYRKCDGARKKLYNYKGYTWYSTSELYPTVRFD